MGIDYNITLAVGYEFSRTEIYELFGRKTPRSSHMEDRYDPKTGEKLDPIEVVDNDEYVALFFEDEEMDEITLVETICSKIEATYVDETDMWGMGLRSVVIGPRLRQVGGGYDEGHVSVSGGHYWDDVHDATSELYRIRDQLVGLGLKPARAIVQPVLSIY